MTSDEIITLSLKLISSALIILGIVLGIDSILSPANPMDCAIGVMLSLICLIVGALSFNQIKKLEKGDE